MSDTRECQHVSRGGRSLNGAAAWRVVDIPWAESLLKNCHYTDWIERKSALNCPPHMFPDLDRLAAPHVCWFSKDRPLLAQESWPPRRFFEKELLAMSCHCFLLSPGVTGNRNYTSDSARDVGIPAALFQHSHQRKTRCCLSAWRRLRSRGIDGNQPILA